jgi:hypothetical protein
LSFAAERAEIVSLRRAFNQLMGWKFVGINTYGCEFLLLSVRRITGSVTKVLQKR